MQPHRPSLRHLVWSLSLTLIVGLPLEIQAASPHSVVSVNASNPVLHGLEVKTTVDTDRRWINFRGPQLYSSPDQKDPSGPPSYLNWYAIRKPAPEPIKTIRLSDQYSGQQSFTVSLQSPAFYLLPAQTITNGPPDEIPDTLDHYLAFRIADVDSLALPEPTPGKPAYVCLPAQQWHHAEHVEIKSENDLLMVYEIEPATANAKVTTIDPFGLNTLTAGEKRFVYVSARRVETD